VDPGLPAWANFCRARGAEFMHLGGSKQIDRIDNQIRYLILVTTHDALQVRLGQGHTSKQRPAPLSPGCANREIGVPRKGAPSCGYTIQPLLWYSMKSAVCWAIERP